MFYVTFLGNMFTAPIFAVRVMRFVLAMHRTASAEIQHFEHISKVDLFK